MVREVLQNSLDHHEPGLDGVRVTFRTLSIPAEDIQATQLLQHARASLQEAEAGQNPDTTRHYSEMEAALSVNQIPCLAIVDENTTGLQGDNWKNLIFREGMPQNTGNVTKGGSVGLGKHASFNLSACNTVIYSTRYVARAARGKVCHMAGRSQLMTHEDPSGSHGRLRDVGFLGNHQDNGYNEPISGTGHSQGLPPPELGNRRVHHRVQKRKISRLDQAGNPGNPTKLLLRHPHRQPGGSPAGPKCRHPVNSRPEEPGRRHGTTWREKPVKALLRGNPGSTSENQSQWKAGTLPENDGLDQHQSEMPQSGLPT